MLPRLAPAGPVAILGPTYAEHGHAWRKAGYAVSETAAPAEAAATMIVVNPNNPDGRVLSPAELASLATHCAANGGLLVVDEAFADFTPEDSVVPDLPDGTIVLRSFGKTYGLAGLRLGFAIGAPESMARLKAALGPWSVAGPALHVGAMALSDAGWLAEAGAERARDAARLDALLASHGRIVGGTTLFRLLETPRAAALFARLGRHGIYVRRFRMRRIACASGCPAPKPNGSACALRSPSMPRKHRRQREACMRRMRGQEPAGRLTSLEQGFGRDDAWHSYRRKAT